MTELGIVVSWEDVFSTVTKQIIVSNVLFLKKRATRGDIRVTKVAPVCCYQQRSNILYSLTVII